MGFSLAAGVNLYATVAILGLAARYGWVALPEQFQAFNNEYIIIAAILMYLVEFFADKIPSFDSLWDAIHTAIRPIGGAVRSRPSVTRHLAYRRWRHCSAARLRRAAT